MKKAPKNRKSERKQQKTTENKKAKRQKKLFCFLFECNMIFGALFSKKCSYLIFGALFSKKRKKAQKN